MTDYVRKDSVSNLKPLSTFTVMNSAVLIFDKGAEYCLYNFSFYNNFIQNVAYA